MFGRLLDRLRGRDPQSDESMRDRRELRDLDRRLDDPGDLSRVGEREADDAFDAAEGRPDPEL